MFLNDGEVHSGTSFALIAFIQLFEMRPPISVRIRADESKGWQIMENAQSILIVDDDRTHCLMLGIILRNFGYDTHEARNGLDALQLIHQEKVDLVLMDIYMPGLSGIEVLAEIKSFKPCMPVILMTAYCSEKTILEAKNRCAVDVLSKPLHLEELKEVIARVFREGCLA